MGACSTQSSTSGVASWVGSAGARGPFFVVLPARPREKKDEFDERETARGERGVWRQARRVMLGVMIRIVIMIRRMISEIQD